MRRRLKLTGISAQGRVETPQTSHHLQHTLIRSYGLLLAFAYGCVLCSCAEPPTPPSLASDPLVPLVSATHRHVHTYIPTYHTLLLAIHYIHTTYVHTHPYASTSHAIHNTTRK
ncbi:uncharacterized protein GGS22DRAFT_43065 [Annulohypoxylon maeteangense]|uniref:uncharacterized protein n=1 Tax=Annulohypoxylon maeteangense TaxID=1927788 RepID=UPI0020083AC2|nr:uncharacterized protein GGS22DRAFT_43065 [Annulohypoxylon maeteangense]KAI0882987.1 hypothetical protein GGS22DRAFT_43065 [Annulohypoxylon maeteangense]